MIILIFLQMEAFRSFFVSLNLPYSVVRGEQLALQANVFNYMTQDMNVSLNSNETEYALKNVNIKCK